MMEAFRAVASRKGAPVRNASHQSGFRLGKQHQRTVNPPSAMPNSAASACAGVRRLNESLEPLDFSAKAVRACSPRSETVPHVV